MSENHRLPDYLEHIQQAVIILNNAVRSELSAVNSG